MEHRLRRATVACVALLAAALALAAAPAFAYEVLDNGKLRFGHGSEASVNPSGNFQQPFYYDGNYSTWFPLTYANYPLDNAVGIGGDGAQEWNLNGIIQENGTLTNQVLDISGFTPTGGSNGYGTIVSTGTLTIMGKTLEMKNSYTLGQTASFVKIVTRITNTSGAAVTNLRVWVGTRDDNVSGDDQPLKEKGNLVNGQFVLISNPATRAQGLMITANQAGVLFYSTSPKANTAINYCCSFAQAYGQDPNTSGIQVGGDGSYALFVRMDDLANGASEEFTWYYAAGEVANLTNIATEVSQAAPQDWTVTASAGTGGALSPTHATVANNATTSFTVAPAAGYGIGSVTGCGGSLAGNTYSTGAITGNCTVTAGFTLNSYTVTASAGNGGSLSPGNASLNHGATTSFTVTPAAGYNIASVQGCGGTLANNTFTTGTITGACTVTASFALKTYTVTAGMQSGGFVGPASATVNHGGTTSFTVTPAIGYSIVSASGCNGLLIGNTYATGPVAGDCAVSANFALNAYAVTASAGPGGSVGSANVTATHGTSATFTVTPATGYSIAGVQGCDGLLNGITYTTAAVTGACAIAIEFVQTPPVFTPALPSPHEIDASALTVELPANLAPQAVDYQGNPLEVTLVGGQTRYEPGEHVLTWRTVDSRGVAATVQQTLRVQPTVSMGKDVSLGFREGNSGFIRIALNGRSPVYPFTVHYTVSGYAQGHDLQSGTAVFQQGETQKDIYFAILQTPAAGAPDRQVQVALDEGVNVGTRHALSVSLITVNAAPIVMLSGQQDGAPVPVFARSGGQIAIVADIQDPNSNDIHTLQWTPPSGALVTVEDGRLLLQADSLPAGVHRFEVVATDNGTPTLGSRGVFDLVLREAAIPLPQGVQRWAANGLPDDPAYNPATPNILPERAGELHHYIVEGDPGVELRLGPNALLIGQAQAELEDMTSILGADSITNVGGYFDFIVDDLPQLGQSVNVVLPQRAQIPQNSVYRKFNTRTRRWQNFVTDVHNTLASAPGSAGHCPAPSSDQYRAGLNAGDWCVRLTLSDGGPNDDDGRENGSISDPGGVAALAAVTVTTTGSGSGGGGGGAMDLWILMLGFILLAIRSKRRLLAPAIVMLIPVVACAGAPSFDTGNLYFGGELGQARGEVTEKDLNAQLTAAAYDVTADYDDRTRTAWRLFAGYEVSPYFALQLGYTDLGEIGATLTGNVVDIQEFLASANRLQPRSANGIELSAIGRYPLTARFSILGRAGLLRWDSSYRSTDNSAAFDGLKTHGSTGLLGAGVEFKLSEHWAFVADWTRYHIDGERIGAAGVGMAYSL